MAGRTSAAEAGATFRRGEISGEAASDVATRLRFCTGLGAGEMEGDSPALALRDARVFLPIVITERRASACAVREREAIDQTHV